MSETKNKRDFYEVRIKGIKKPLIACGHNCNGEYTRQRITLYCERMFDEAGVGEECINPESIEFQTKILGKKPKKIFMLCADNTTWIMEDRQNI